MNKAAKLQARWRRLKRPPPGALRRDEERLLLARARAGDRAALERLVRALAGTVHRFGRGFCGQREDAEDVTQEVLASLVRSLATFRGESSLTTWAYVVARNACQRVRRRPRSAPFPDESLDRALGQRGSALEPVDPQPDPERHLERKEIGSALERAIGALPVPQREILLLRDVEGRTTREVAAALGIGERALKSRLHRARLALRSALAPILVDPAGPSRSDERCPSTTLLLSRHLEGDLSARDCAQLQAHVARCPRCAAACSDLQRSIRTCRGLGRRAPPPGLVRSVRGAVRDGLRRRAASRSRGKTS